MAELVTINQQTFESVRQAARKVSYAPDYIARLAREQKIKAVQLGRRWYVHVPTLEAYAEVQQVEQEIRHRHLQQVRQAEQRVYQQLSGTVPKPWRVHVTRYCLVVMAVGVLFLGGAIGLQLSSAVQQLSRVAAVGVIALPEVTAATTRQGIGLRPAFTTDDEITVTTGRTIIHPSEKTQSWVYVQHE